MLTNLEKELLNIIQTDFPVEKKPFKAIGEKLSISEKEAFQLTKGLIEKGIIRRLGATFDSRKLDYASTLCAANVPEDKLEKFVETVNDYNGVTHNYLRPGYYNVWFTFIGKNMEFIENKLKEISEKTGVKEIVNLPAKKLFKVRVNLNV
jgi:DNA-binding Lrp family transcriptional regulator